MQPKKRHVLVWIILLISLIAVILILNSKSYYIESEDGHCGILVTNYWPSQFENPIWATYAFIWADERPECIEIFATGTAQGNVTYESSLRQDYFEFNIRHGILMRHIPWVKHYDIFQLSPKIHPCDELVISWTDTKGIEHSYLFEMP